MSLKINVPTTPSRQTTRRTQSAPPTTPHKPSKGILTALQVAPNANVEYGIGTAADFLDETGNEGATSNHLFTPKSLPPSVADISLTDLGSPSLSPTRSMDYAEGPANVDVFEAAMIGNDQWTASNPFPAPHVRDPQRWIRQTHNNTTEIFSLKKWQQVFSAKYAVFVGNLPASVGDKDLYNLVWELFSRYGLMMMKVSRTGTQMPWAIIQFTNAADAENAVCQVYAANGERQHYIKDRPVRVDYCMAPRDVYVYCADLRDPGM